jgi:hypothetical protein
VASIAIQLEKKRIYILSTDFINHLLYIQKRLRKETEESLILNKLVFKILNLEFEEKTRKVFILFDY